MPDNSKPQFIYFDAGYTIIRPTPSVGYHYAQIAGLHGVNADPQALEAAFRNAWHGARQSQAINPELPYGRTEAEARQFWQGVVDQCFQLAGTPSPGTAEFHRQLFDRFGECQCWELYPDAEQAFHFLEERGIPWGVLSNWDSRLRRVLEGFGLLPRLGAVVISSDVGFEKPHPAIYKHAEEAVAGSPRIALIGDEADADGHGAIAAGWQSVIVWRSQKPPPPGLVAVPTLFDAVQHLIDK